MANIKSAIKNIKKSEKRHLQNQIRKSQFRTAVKKVLLLAQKGEDVSQSLSEAFSKIDKAAKVGAIHKKQAARRKSRLVKKVRSFQAQVQTAQK
ncbi:30S ribosomal protein S20 [Athalassotoga saccharophila]|uniref:30S ribosomal protein S20 n=1 Tax=Athalassotoga saccharophila TaxID=1441386 RepID=UPI00137A93AA|nr:30S ribosomal protein S20 [Athalassotoga saccharophila]BBJ27312.1 30S ribosomal protein S20 [Athalassotoga saccharophila]